MLQLEQAECSVTHHFGPGICVREVFLPGGTVAIGHHQNFAHFNIMRKGRVTLFTEDGPVELVDHFMGVLPPGRKIGHIHEDTIWQNIYATDETDVEAIENHFVTKSDTWREADLANRQKLLEWNTDFTRRDYYKVLEEFGFTHEQARSQSEATDMTDLPYGTYKIRVADSTIEGKGLFATGNIAAGEVIAPARIDGKRTIAGRYTNHSPSPNAAMVRGNGNDIFLAATKPIAGNSGGFDGEEITVDYRAALTLNFEIAATLK